jgi:hypothetical protein
MLLASTLEASGQALTGNIYGKVVDEQAGVLPGVSVTLSGIGADQTTFTDARGEFHFLNLSPGSYALTSTLQGFTSVRRENVVVTLGKNTELTIPMALSAVSATVTVTSEVPLLDTRTVEAGHTFSQVELEKIPTARDPWVILQVSPGVLMDRQNVGGSQSGQQSYYTGKGTDSTQNTWNVDGVTITDMTATGGSPTYYDFDAFQEMQVTTGGADPAIASPGVAINMVTKRGTNQAHGSSRVFVTDHRFQANNIPHEAVDQGLTTTDRIDGIQDYGAEAGGPIWTDKVWLWGSYGRDQINRLLTGGSLDRTTLENIDGKLSIQPIESNSATLFYFRGDKTKQGRGAGVTRPQPTSWDQSGPTTIWKGDDSQVFSSSFVANVAYSYARNGFELLPQGGLNVDAYRDLNGIWQRSYLHYDTDRPQHQVSANGSYFFNTGSLGNELKFGFGYRKADLASLTAWPGSGNFIQIDRNRVRITRDKVLSADTKYTDAFIGDTITASNLTINAGLRYDYQTGQNLPSTAPANPVFPQLLGTLSYPGGGQEVKWKNWEPRVGATYALGAQKTTLLKASYSRYADQLGTPNVSFNNPNGYPAYLNYHFTDTNGDHTIQPGELGSLISANYVDPLNPNSAVSPNQIDPNLKATTTDEFTFGVEHQLMPELVVAASYTYRERKDFVYYTMVGVNPSDFVQISPSDLGCTAGPNGGCLGYDLNGKLIGETGPIYGVPNYNGNFGLLETNRPGYKTTYNGVELQLTKRLSHGWMAHGSFTWTNWKQNKGECFDPTNTVNGNFSPSTVGTSGANSCADDIVYFGGNGIGGTSNTYINSTWQFNVNGLYQFPLGFNLAANLYGRQGYPLPYFVTVVADGSPLGLKNAAIGAADATRLDDLYQLDLRVEKVIGLFNNQANVTLSVDLFNALNGNAILERRNDATEITAGHGSANTIATIQSPRIVRFGARFSF